MSSWVRVSDRLPPRENEVWLYNESTGDMWVGALCWEACEWVFARSFRTFWWSDNDYKWYGVYTVDNDYRPTHWAHLSFPPPYDEGDK